jgi:uncharacterized protein YndB with AHSA1/START domain
MPVTDVHKDTDAMTMTIAARFPANAERIWRLWSDPRELERWWGPPGYPATFVEHELSPDARVAYYMTSPENERYHGWWQVLEVDPPRRLRFEDGFADADGNPVDSMPKSVATVTLAESDGATTMTIATRFASREDMDKTLAMGAEEGMKAALGQIDDLLRA